MEMAELAAKAEQVRSRVAEEGTTASSAADGLELVRREVTCPTCDKVWEVELPQMLGVPRMRQCGDCSRVAEAKAVVDEERHRAERHHASSRWAMEHWPEIMEDVGINSRVYGEASLEAWRLDPGEDVAWMAARRFCANVRRFVSDPTAPVGGLLLVGSPGTGKTHLAAAIVRRLVEDLTLPPDTVRWDRALRFDSLIKSSYDEGGTIRFLEARDYARLWVVQDLGREKPNEHFAAILADLMDAREGSPTLITSNFMPNELVERYPDPTGALDSRFARFEAVSVKGRDRRGTWA